MPSLLRIAGVAARSPASSGSPCAGCGESAAAAGSRRSACCWQASGWWSSAPSRTWCGPIQDVLGLSGEPLGRLVTVLVVSVATLFLLVFYALGRADRANQRVSRLVRALSAAQVEAASLGAGWGGVLVCIPAFNEAESLPAVLAEIPAEVAGLRTHVLVIDDGSRDGTPGVARSLGARVVSHPVNSGQGAALQTGYLVAERLGVDVVVTLDADGQHDPGQMARLVEPIVRDEADFVVGSRRMDEGASESDSRARDAGITRLHAADQPARRNGGQRHRQRLPRHPRLTPGGDRVHRGPVPQPGAVAGGRTGRATGDRRPGHDPTPDCRRRPRRGRTCATGWASCGSCSRRGCGDFRKPGCG